MFVVDNYLFAVILCFITMLCWGSWGNTQKLAAKNWRFELFYWDYVIGVFLFSLLLGFTFGSYGENGRSFVQDLQQANGPNIISALFGGVVFNIANILLSASISLAGLSVAFPLGIGIALVLGVFVNYFTIPKGDPIILFTGVALITLAIILNGIAAGSIKKNTDSKNLEETKIKKGIILALIAGVFMSFFYKFVATSMDLGNFIQPATGKLTPYSAFFIFSLGILLSNFIVNSLVMKRPFVGAPVNYKQYFEGNFKTHLTGILGGAIWALGTSANYIAAGKAGAAISYGLGQGATLIAAIWGVFIWKEFRDSSKNTYWLLVAMFILFIIGLLLIIYSGGN